MALSDEEQVVDPAQDVFDAEQQVGAGHLGPIRLRGDHERRRRRHHACGLCRSLGTLEAYEHVGERLFEAQPRLFRLAVCRLAELTTTHGVGPVSPVAYIFMADVRCNELEDLAAGRHAGELGLRLADHLSSPSRSPQGAAQLASSLVGNARMLFDIAIGARTVHPTALPERFAGHFRRATEAGDLQVASASGYQASLAALVGGTELAKTEALALEYRSKARGFGQLMLARAIQGVAELAGVLLGRRAVAEAAGAGRTVSSGEPKGGETVHLASVRTRVIGPEMMVRCVLRERRAALATARESLAMSNVVVPVVPFDFYRCLIFLDGSVGMSMMGPATWA